jgi:hypothetical protein
MFDPVEPPKDISSVKITDVLHYEGDIYKCIHVFMKESHFIFSGTGAVFENKLCINKYSPSSYH